MSYLFLHSLLICMYFTYLGAKIAGGRGYYLKDAGVDLNQALIMFALDFLRKKGYSRLQTPFFMRQDIMGKCAQLAQFDEELYKVTPLSFNKHGFLKS